MRTLIIYDNTGRIWYQASGNVQEPVGLQYRWFNLEPGKFAKRIDVSDMNNPVPIYDDTSEVTGNKGTENVESEDNGEDVSNKENE